MRLRRAAVRFRPETGASRPPLSGLSDLDVTQSGGSSPSSRSAVSALSIASFCFSRSLMIPAMPSFGIILAWECLQFGPPDVFRAAMPAASPAAEGAYAYVRLSTSLLQRRAVFRFRMENAVRSNVHAGFNGPRSPRDPPALGPRSFRRLAAVAREPRFRTREVGIVLV